MFSKRRVRGKLYSDVKSRINKYLNDTGYTDNNIYLIHYDGSVNRLKDAVSNKNIFKKCIKNLPAIKQIGIKNADIRVYNNIRINFKKNNQRISTKIALPLNGIRSGSLARAIRGRKILDKHTSINIPKLINYDKENYFWLEEQFIKTVDNIHKKDKIHNYLSRYASEFYKPFMRYRPVNETLHLTNINIKQFKKSLAKFNLDKIQLNRMWPVSFIHGDLTPSNILITSDGNYFISDLEFFSKSPIVWDLKKCYFFCPELTIRFIEKFSLPSSKNGIGAIEQLLIIFICQLEKINSEIETSTKYLIRNRGFNQEEANTRIRERKNKLNKEIAKLMSYQN